MIDSYFNDKTKCTACTACVNACPVCAIEMKTDENGFAYADVDSGKCIGCGKCDSVCHLKGGTPEKNKIEKTYLFVHNNADVLKKSSSGGAFTAISDYVLSLGGVVFGTALNGEMKPEFTRAETVEERNEMRKTLYVQSDVHGIYSEVKASLESGRYTMFIGTPCQVAGLISFLGKSADTEKLVSVDLICHGLPSEKMFTDHIEHLEKKHGAKAKTYSIHDKKFSWFPVGIGEIELDNGKKYSTAEDQNYIHFFYRNISLRDSCYTCEYQSDCRVSDLTIGDCWGIKKIDGKRHREGASVVSVNTEKGKKLFDKISGGCSLEIPSEKTQFTTDMKPPKMSVKRDEFFRVYRESGYEAVIEKFGKMTLREKVMYNLKKGARRLIFIGKFAFRRKGGVK